MITPDLKQCQALLNALRKGSPAEPELASADSLERAWQLTAAWGACHWLGQTDSEPLDDQVIRAAWTYGFAFIDELTQTVDALGELWDHWPGDPADLIELIMDDRIEIHASEQAFEHIGQIDIRWARFVDLLDDSLQEHIEFLTVLVQSGWLDAWNQALEPRSRPWWHNAIMQACQQLRQKTSAQPRALFWIRPAKIAAQTVQDDFENIPKPGPIWQWVAPDGLHRAWLTLPLGPVAPDALLTLELESLNNEPWESANFAQLTLNEIAPCDADQGLIRFRAIDYLNQSQEHMLNPIFRVNGVIWPSQNPT